MAHHSLSLLGSLAAVAALASACTKERPQATGTESAAAPAATEGAAAPAADYKSVAHRVVTQSAGVSEGDLVLISGSADDLPLLEDIAVEVAKVGGSSLVSIETASLSRRLYDEVPAKYDSKEPRFAMNIAKNVDVMISTEWGEGKTLKGVPAERIIARGKTFQPIMATMRKRGIRFVSLGNGLYPNAERSELFGMSRDDLSKVMYEGIDADYAQLVATGAEIQKTLAKGSLVHVTSPGGTDFKVSIKGRPVLVSDGVISAEDRKRGGAATSVWLPAGEVYVTPVAGTAEGVIVADHLFYEGSRIDGLRLEFKAGRMTSMTAKSDLGSLKTFYDASGEGKDLFGVVDIGINPNIHVPEGSPVNVWSRAGAVTLSLGNNTWAGGDNQVGFGLPPEVPKATLTVDGREVVKDGKLVAPLSVASQH
ncbi:MAG TPA: aminopeptidase [Gemmatimonadales bacterium]|jgi:leucyl aminopeptidase (aminopeptidase T)